MAGPMWDTHRGLIVGLKARRSWFRPPRAFMAAVGRADLLDVWLGDVSRLEIGRL